MEEALLEGGNNIRDFARSRRRSEVEYVAYLDGMSEVPGSYGTPSSSIKRRLRIVEQNSFEELHQSLQYYMVQSHNYKK